MHPLMNNTKWDELCSMPYNVPRPLEWRFKDLKTGTISEWSTDWEVLSSLKKKWKDIEWFEIKFHNNKSEIIEDLRKIHVPGTYDDNSVKIFGYSSDFVDYI